VSHIHDNLKDMAQIHDKSFLKRLKRKRKRKRLFLFFLKRSVSYSWQFERYGSNSWRIFSKNDWSSFPKRVSFLKESRIFLIIFSKILKDFCARTHTRTHTYTHTMPWGHHELFLRQKRPIIPRQKRPISLLKIIGLFCKRAL